MWIGWMWIIMCVKNPYRLISSMIFLCATVDGFFYWFPTAWLFQVYVISHTKKNILVSTVLTQTIFSSDPRDVLVLANFVAADIFIWTIFLNWKQKYLEKNSANPLTLYFLQMLIETRYLYFWPNSWLFPFLFGNSPVCVHWAISFPQMWIKYVIHCQSFICMIFKQMTAIAK